VPEEEEVGEIGRAEVIQEGVHLTVISWGSMIPLVRDACRQVSDARGVSVEIVDLRTLSPFDEDTVAASTRKTGRCVVVQEAPKTLGMASEVIACINDKELLSLEAPVTRVTGYDVVTPYFGRERGYIPSVARIRQAIEKTLDF
jgi:pyruvate dehydrogenase E1 component beta subunit